MVIIYALSDESGEIRYVGKTKQYLKQRLYSHIKECYSGRKSHKISWIKSLLKNDKRPIISILETVEEDNWQHWEKYWIEKLRNEGCNLTNLTEGGQGGNGYSHTEESKQRMSKSKKGRKLSDEQKLKLSEGQKKKHAESPSYNRSGNNIKKNIDKDLLYKLYIIENLSMTKISKKLNCSEAKIYKSLKECGIEKPEHLRQFPDRQKPVLQYDLEGNLVGEWVSPEEVKKKLNISVSNCCIGRQKTCGGFIWRYKYEWFDLNLDKLDENSKKVSQYDLDGNWIRDYDSIYEASEDTGINKGNICECCRGKYKSAGKYIWRYYGDNPPKKYTNKTLKSVCQYDLDGNFIMEFDSITEAAKKTGSRSNCIQMCCVGKFKYSNGFIWRYK